MELENLSAVSPHPGIPSDLADLFPRVAQVRQQISAAIEKRREATSALSHSLATLESAQATQSAGQLSGELDALYSAAVSHLRQLDASWPAPDARAALPALHARFAFLTKWRDQLRESLLQLQLS
jgi:hypothetical protein